MTSNICFALRGTLSKKVTSAIPKEKNLTSTNLYALMTFICFFLCMPFAAVIEVRRRERARRPASPGCDRTRGARAGLQGERLKKAWPPVSGVSAIPEKIMGVKVLSTDKLQARALRAPPPPPTPVARALFETPTFMFALGRSS